MTEFHVEVVRIGSIERHPNADTLSVTNIHGGYPVCFRTGEFNEGDLAVYLPVDSVAPDKPEWEPAKTGDALAIFDIWNSALGRWHDHADVVSMCKFLDLPRAPVLTSGPFGDIRAGLEALAEGQTTIGGATHVREGWVIKPAVERRDNRIGRVILKMHSQGFLTRKGA